MCICWEYGQVVQANNCVDDSLLNMEDDEDEFELLVVIICRSVPSSGQNHMMQRC